MLEESLEEFPGALVLVTHDRFLLDRVCNQVLGFNGRGKAEYFADYEQWLDMLQDLERKENTVAKPSPGKQEKAGNKPKRNNFV